MTKTAASSVVSVREPPAHTSTLHRIRAAAAISRSILRMRASSSDTTMFSAALVGGTCDGGHTPRQKLSRLWVSDHVLFCGGDVEISIALHGRFGTHPEVPAISPLPPLHVARRIPLCELAGSPLPRHHYIGQDLPASCPMWYRKQPVDTFRR